MPTHGSGSLHLQCLSVKFPFPLLILSPRSCLSGCLAGSASPHPRPTSPTLRALTLLYRLRAGALLSPYPCNLFLSHPHPLPLAFENRIFLLVALFFLVALCATRRAEILALHSTATSRFRTADDPSEKDPPTTFNHPLPTLLDTDLPSPRATHHPSLAPSTFAL
jgi:hypothetical protein